MLTVPKCRAVQLLSKVSRIVSFFPCNSPLLHRDRTAPPSQYPLGAFTPLDGVVLFTRFETKNCLTQRIPFVAGLLSQWPWKTVEEDSSYSLSLCKAGLLVYNVLV